MVGIKNINDIKHEFFSGLIHQYRLFIDDICYKIQSIETFDGIDSIESDVLTFDEQANNYVNTYIEKIINSLDEKSLIKEYKELYKKYGIVLRTNRKYAITLVTKNGEYKIMRTYLTPETNEDYQKLQKLEGVSVIIPKDEYFGLSVLPTKLTVGAMLLAARTAIEIPSYVKASKILLRDHNIKICSATMMEVTNIIGGIAFKNEYEKAISGYELLNNSKLIFKKDINKVIYIETDGAMFNTRHTDENGSSWAENKLGLVFSTDNIKTYKNHRTGESYHRILRREYTSYIGNSEIFKKFLFSCALRNGYGSYKETVLISDGAKWIKTIKEECFPDAVHILDFFHLKHKLYSFGKIYFNYDEEKYTRWVEKMCGLFRASEHIKAIKELVKMQPKVSKSNNGFDLVSYLNNNLQCIDYANYRSRGFFIGSGAIEGANKTVLHARLKQSGMRWSKESAQKVVTLKSLLESDLWFENVTKIVRQYYGLKSINRLILDG
jgi:hypothetical protein